MPKSRQRSAGHITFALALSIGAAPAFWVTSASCDAQRGYTTTSEMLVLYDAANREGRLSLEADFASRLDGMNWVEAGLKSEKTFCFPPKKNYPNGVELVAMVRLYVSEDPFYGLMPIGLTLLKMVEKRYPCSANSN